MTEWNCSPSWVRNEKILIHQSKRQSLPISIIGRQRRARTACVARRTRVLWNSRAYTGWPISTCLCVEIGRDARDIQLYSLKTPSMAYIPVHHAAKPAQSDQRDKVGRRHQELGP